MIEDMHQSNEENFASQFVCVIQVHI